MIFGINENTSATAVAASPYEANLEGALMHVYENECNYNAIMKAVGLSELKYYQENNGAELFNEAGAAKGFIDKVVSFFKACLDKIKAIGKKIYETISGFVRSDKKFVEHARKELTGKDLKGMKFKGYDFGSVTPEFPEISLEVSNNAGDYTAAGSKDAQEEQKKKQRGACIGKGPLTEQELRKELKKALYGEEKKEITVDTDAALKTISDTKQVLASINLAEKKITNTIQAYIKALQAAKKFFSTDKEANSTAIGSLNEKIALAKAQSNDATVVFGMLCQQAKDKNRQAKAMCVKAINYKPEGSKKNESALYGDLFAGVQIL